MSRSTPPAIQEHQDKQQSPHHNMQENVMFQSYIQVQNGASTVLATKSNPSSLSPSPSTCFRVATATPTSPESIGASRNQNSIAISTQSFVPSDHHSHSDLTTQQQEPGTLQSDQDCHTPAAAVSTANNNATAVITTSNISSLPPPSYCDSTSAVRSHHPLMEHHNDNLRSNSPISVHPIYNSNIPINPSSYGAVAHDYLHAPTSYMHHSQLPSAEWIAAENGDTSSILAAAVAKAELDSMSAYQQQHHPFQTTSESPHHRGVMLPGGSANSMGNGMESWAPWASSTMGSGSNGDHPSGDEMSQGHHMSDSMDHSTSPVTGSPLKSLQQQPASSSTSGKSIDNTIASLPGH